MNNKDYIKRRDEISSGVFTGVYRGEEWAVTGNQGLIDQAIDQLVLDVIGEVQEYKRPSKYSYKHKIQFHARNGLSAAQRKIVRPE